MTMMFAQALMEYGATATLAESITHLSIRLGDTLGEWRVEAMVAGVAAVFLWRVVTAAR